MKTMIRMGLLALVVACAGSEPMRRVEQGLASGELASLPPAHGAVPSNAESGTTVVGEHDALEPRESLTLEQALDVALEHHPELELARAQVALARARQSGAGALDDPELIAGVESAPLDGDTFGDAGLVLGIGQAFPLSSTRAHDREARQFESEAAVFAARARMIEVRQGVTSSFATALYAQRVAELLDDLVVTTERSLKVLKARIDSGDAVQSEEAESGLAYARVSREAVRARALAKRSLVELAAAMGVPRLELGSVSGDLDESLALPTLELLVQRIDERPELLESRGLTRAAEADMAFAEAARVPRLHVELLYRQLGSTDEDEFDAVLRLPLQWSRTGKARVAESRELVAQARARERVARDAAEADVRLAHLELSRALAEASFQQREVLPRLEALRELAERRLALGDVSVVTALEARERWLEAQLELLAVQRDALQAWATLAPYLDEPQP